MKNLNQSSSISALQLSFIELQVKMINEARIKHFALLHEEEVVYLQFYFQEAPEDLQEKEVDMSALRAWIKQYHAPLVKAYTSERGTSYYHIMELELDSEMKNNFLTYCLINL